MPLLKYDCHSTEMEWKSLQPWDYRLICRLLSHGPSMLPANSVRLTGCALRKQMCSSDPAACCQGHLAVGGRNAG